MSKGKKNVLDEQLEEFTSERKARPQPLIVSISHSPNGTIAGVDKDGKLWSYDAWERTWKEFR